MAKGKKKPKVMQFGDNKRGMMLQINPNVLKEKGDAERMLEALKLEMLDSDYPK